jgi:hypothetical protein
MRGVVMRMALSFALRKRPRKVDSAARAAGVGESGTTEPSTRTETLGCVRGNGRLRRDAMGTLLEPSVGRAMSKGKAGAVMSMTGGIGFIMVARPESARLRPVVTIEKDSRVIRSPMSGKGTFLPG